jgi:hypothetical protein
MASGFKFSPRCDASATCCGGGANCTWFDDDFERAASSTLGDQWQEVVGDWEIDASGRLVVDTSDARARPRWESSPGIWVNFDNLSTFDLRAIVSATADGDEILFGTRHSTAGEIYTLGLRVGAAAKIWFGDTDPAGAVWYDCPVTAAANTEHELVMDCGVIYLNGTAVANVIGLIDRTQAADFFVGTNDVTGEVRIHELEITKTRVSHPATSCPTCPDCPTFLGETPASRTVTVAGHTGRWAVLNGAYVVDQTQSFNRTAGSPECLYVIEDLGINFDVFGDASVFDTVDTLTIRLQGGAANATFQGSIGGVDVQYQTPFPWPLPCIGDDIVLNYSSSGYGATNLDPGNSQAGATTTIPL